MDARTYSKAEADRSSKRPEAWVKVPLWWIVLAAKHARSPATLVLVELLYRAWKEKRPTFSLPNKRLQQQGVSRDTKRRVLADLERAGFITVERPKRRAPVVTLIGL